MQEIFAKLGQQIKNRRLELKLSREELGYRCGLHRNGISKIENAQSEIKLSTLIKIFKQLNMDFDIVQELVNLYDK